MGEKQWSIGINDQLANTPNTSGSVSTHHWIERVIEINNIESEQWSKRCIYRVPVCVTELNNRAYKPQIVSFGPYHHDVQDLKAMEKHKHRALLHFLKRSNITFKTIVEALTPVVQELKDAYDQLDPKWQKCTEEFLDMMIVDGCFVLEILRAATNVTTRPQDPSSHDQTSVDRDYATNDPIFSTHGKLYIVPYLKRDMLMLENQIPMMVLEKLVSVGNENSLKKDKELTKRILNFFSQSVKNLQQFGNCLHILEVYRKSLILEEPGSETHKPKDREQSNILGGGGDEIIRSATKLIEAGISIKKSESRSLRAISFDRGVLKLPLIEVDDALESLYLNLIAFERFHVGAGNDVTSYIFFMDNIIDNSRDVSLLHSCGVIQNALGSDKAVAKLFNSLSKDITLDQESRLGEVRKRVGAYCQQPWHQWRANLMHTYFTNPWAILSVIAAIFLFALTILQTIYTVLGYVSPPSS